MTFAQNSKQVDKKELSQQILITLEKIIKNSQNWEGSEPKTPIAKAFVKNQKNAFQQLCFYAQYKPQDPSRIDAMALEYFKWKTIYTAYNHPQKILYDLHENKLTKRLQKSLIQHFLGNQSFKDKNTQDYLTNLSQKIHSKLLNNR